MKDQFRHILDLVRRTGDTMIVTDPNGEDVYVVMDIKQYEMFLDSAEGSCYEDIDLEDDDIFEDFEDEGVNEKQEPIEEPVQKGGSETDIWHAMKPANEQGETWNTSEMSDEELVNIESQYQKFITNTTEQASVEVNHQEILENKPKDDDFGEEEFYLEPLE